MIQYLDARLLITTSTVEVKHVIDCCLALFFTDCPRGLVPGSANPLPDWANAQLPRKGYNFQPQPIVQES